MPAHDTSVAFADEIVVDGRLDVTVWEWWSHTDGGIVHYYASGPCPACFATAQGHVELVAQPVDRQGAGPAEDGSAGRPETVEVPVGCRCGTGHGEDGAKGCGRRWTIVGPGDDA